jgi:hypothetical protein
MGADLVGLGVIGLLCWWLLRVAKQSGTTPQSVREAGRERWIADEPKRGRWRRLNYYLWVLFGLL